MTTALALVLIPATVVGVFCLSLTSENDIAGTGVARHRPFMQQVSSFHETWRSHFVPLVFRKAQVTSYDTIPRFAYQEEPLTAPVSRVALALVGLLIPASVLALVGLWGLRRYPVVA